MNAKLLLPILVTLHCVNCAGPISQKQEIIPVVNKDYLPRALAIIDNAGARIDFISLEFHYDGTIKRIQDSLARAVKRGVRVRGLIENEIDFNKKSVNYLNKYGIEAKLDTPEKMAHNKLFIIDESVVLLGSTNLSGNSIQRNNETNVLIRDPAIAGFFERYFEKLWKDSAAEPNMELFTAGNVTVITNRLYLKEVLSLFDGAKKSIRVLMYGIHTSKKGKGKSVGRLVDALIAATKRGVTVRVLMDKSDYNDAINAINENTRKILEAGGVQVRYDDAKITSHAKLICVDDRIIVGSYNWGYDALERRNECAVLINNPSTTEFFNRYFDTLWAGKRWGGKANSKSETRNFE